MEQDLVLKALDLAHRDGRHNGVQMKKMQGAADVYELRASEDLRMLAVLNGGVLNVFGVGHHNSALDSAVRLSRTRTVAEARAAAQYVSPFLTVPEYVSPTDAAEDLLPAAEEALPPEPHDLWDECIRELTVEGVSLSSAPENLLARLSAVEKRWLEHLSRYRSDQELFADDDLLQAFEREFGADRIFNLLPLLPRSSFISTAAAPTYRVRSRESLKHFVDQKTTALPYNLPATSWAVIEREVKGPLFVKGGPGSGKTLVAIYHAIDQCGRASLLGEPRVLYLTYTNSLIEDARRKTIDLLGAIPGNLEMVAIDRKARQIADVRGVVYEKKQLMPYAEAALAQAQKMIKDFKFDASFLIDEVKNVIEKRALQSSAEYETTSRQGRKRPLQANERKKVWLWRDLLLAELRKKKLQTRDESIRAAVGTAEALSEERRYDVVIIDEVQDLSISEVRLFRALAKSTSGKPHLLFCGDTGQSIYRKGFRWQDAGLQIRGGSVVTLETCERSTGEIMKFAEHLAAGIADDEAASAELSSRTGKKPKIIEGFSGRLAQYDYIVGLLNDEIVTKRKEPAKFAVIARFRERLEALARCAGEDALFKAALYDTDAFYARDTVKLITAHSAKGLEFDTVIVLCAEDFPAPKHLVAEHSDDEEWLDAESRLLYVACTRARNILQLVCTRPTALLAGSEMVADVDSVAVKS